EPDIAKIVVHRNRNSRIPFASAEYQKTIASMVENPGNSGCAGFPTSPRRLLRYWVHRPGEKRSFYIAIRLISAADRESQPGMPVPGFVPSRTAPNSWYPLPHDDSSRTAGQRFPVGQ